MYMYVFHLVLYGSNSVIIYKSMYIFINILVNILTTKFLNILQHQILQSDESNKQLAYIIHISTDMIRVITEESE